MTPSIVPRISRRHGSLFFKLLALMLGMVFLTLLWLGFFFRAWWSPDARESTVRNLREYAELMTGKLGTPPDYDRAQMLSNRLGIGIAIRNPQGEWWFAPRVPPAIRERILTRDRERHLNPNGGRYDSLLTEIRGGRMVAIIPSGGYTFVYGSRTRQPFENGPWEWLLLFGGLAGLWMVAWLFVRRQLHPLRELARGVTAVERGELETRIPEQGSNELADLARSFNSMTRSLKERLTARDQLLLDVSHELRSPLTRMRVALAMAEPDATIQSLQDEVEALGKMVSEILETERLKSGAGALKLKPGDLNALVAEKVKNFGDTPPGVIHNRSPLPPVSYDDTRMRLVLRNLLENALKYGKDSERPVEVTTRREGRYAVVEVRNGGPVVPEEEQRIIFEPFYRTDRSRSANPGYGLGLPLCKRIVEGHGGTIAFTSREGEGSTMTVRLPLGDGAEG